MNLLVNFAPMFALVIAQLGENESKLTVAGPLGVICLWLMYRDEKRSKEGEELRKVIGKVGHEMKGMNLNMLLYHATHGPESFRALAQKEMERKQAGQD